MMKTKLFSLAVGVLSTPILAHAVGPTSPPDGICLHAPQLVRDVYNILANLLGLPAC